MSRLPTINKITVEDINPPSEQTEWVRRMVFPLNLFMGSAYSALNKQLTFTENFKASIKNVEFTTSSTYSTNNWSNIVFPHNLGVKSQGCLLIQISQKDNQYGVTSYSGVYIDWLDVNQNVTIKWVSGLANSTTYELTLLIF